VQSWDTAFKTGEANDYNVCTTWGEADTGYYLLDVFKRRVEFAALKLFVPRHRGE
jgi:phage terminase large subunit-like protein